MSVFAALVLYPLWAVAAAAALVALRLARRAGVGLVILCGSLAAWVSGLILLASGVRLAERVLPAGMLLAGAVLHAGTEVATERGGRRPLRAWTWAAYAFGVALAAVGVAAPRALYGQDARGPGPLFVPAAAAAIAVTVGVTVGLAHLAARAQGDARRRRGAVLLAAIFGAAGGGGVIALRVMGWGDVEIAAPLLLVSIALAAYAVLAGEHGRGRALLVQGAAQAVLTAALSAVGLTLFYVVLPSLTPADARPHLAWTALVVFFAALPLEPLRTLTVEALARLLFRRAYNVPDLVADVERSETRAEHAERLAELGRVTGAVAHEIRNPLGVIAAQLKILERHGADPASLAAVRGQLDRARRFLDDLLRYGKPRPLDVRSFEIGPAVALAVAQARQGAGASIDARVSVSEGLRVEGDRAAFTDVVTALVHNALAAPAGDVEVSAREAGGDVVVCVEDDGPGVPRELEETLFEPFVSGRGRDAQHPGTGLGLAIARRWVERHGGSLRHERRAPRGARFVVRWPRRFTPEPA